MPGHPRLMAGHDESQSRRLAIARNKAWKDRLFLILSGAHQHPDEMAPMSTRREHDLLTDRDVPAAAYSGVHTLRAVENFPISGPRISIYPDLIAALAQLKLEAANTNRQ